MNFKNFFLRRVVMAALLGLSGAAQAALTVYTTEASFMAAVSNAGTDDFSTLPAGNLGVAIARSTLTHGYSYGATSPVNLDLFGLAGPPAWLTIDDAGSSLVLSNFGGGVKAVGGNFFNTDFPGAFFAGNLTLTASDGGTPVSSTIIGATASSFVGFVSTGLMSSVSVLADNSGVVVDANGNGDFFYPTVGKLVLAVPEPEAYALMLAGLGWVGFMARRRRA